MINLKEILNGFIVSLLFLAVLVLSKIIKSKLSKDAEISRKFAHLGGGFVALAFPYFFKGFIVPLVLCGIFLLILIFTKKNKILDSIHGVDRVTFGQYLFPITVFLTFFLSKETSFYFISILVLTLSDTFAALVGKRYGLLKINVRGSIKSVEGSVAFIVVTFLCVHIPLLLMTQIDKANCLLIGIVVALVVCGAELISFYGEDNIIIPLSTLFIINNMSVNTVYKNSVLILMLILSIIWILVIFLPVKKFKESSMISFMLVYFLALTVANVQWIIPLIIFNVILTVLIVFYQKVFHIDFKDYNIIKVLQINIPSVAIILLNLTFTYKNIFFITFISNLATFSIITSYYYSYEYLKNRISKQIEFSIIFMSFILNYLLLVLFPLIIFEYKAITILISTLSIVFSIIITLVIIKSQKENIILEHSDKKWNILLISSASILIFSVGLQLILWRYL